MHEILADLDALDPAALKALIRSQQELLRSSRTEIENLKLLIAKLRRMQFGTKSEKLNRHMEQFDADSKIWNRARRKESIRRQT